MSKVWWFIHSFYWFITEPLRRVDLFCRDIIWSYAWYKYGGGSHIGKDWTFRFRVRQAINATKFKE